ncbi:hypothetical protein PQC07_gp046 [Aeromonas phage D3]|uniref:Uncharacterized protein n=3 Tax=Ludhianavirus TaxID=3044751 RepID=A0A514A1P6_9CAUD|nr:hypothetical protein PQC06_gp143 [Aeromonas phage LAh10]YP_010668710.1 hypothetical protein PQC07_gp046 [Aeromonas phage D3]YP_010668977.1 hypothetical protein PQC08_gp046 [Aeromonas phage D6]QEP52265.1 hypothetical protein D9_0058 [Aeromonas phage D9]QDH47155.1 hypothetical protein LAh10_143 [Aeromonas phage LAh10]QDJ96959.1 hypothetical protein D3_0229 [Aeromonas phage D3]QDJ97388.1 hypothetical protein D6_0229 [Aeromonas phage D6]
MFEKLLMRFSFFRRRAKRKLRTTLAVLTEKINQQGAFNDDDIVTIHNIVKSPLISYDESLVLGADETIRFYSVTSNKALVALEKRPDVLSPANLNYDITANPKERPFYTWYSNQDSVRHYVDTVSEMLDAHVDTIVTEIDIKGTWRPTLTEEDQEFHDGLLYRLFLLDLLNIINFYMERQSD